MSSRIQFDPRINLGHALTIATFICAILLSTWQLGSRMGIQASHLESARERIEIIEKARIFREQEVLNRIERLEVAQAAQMQEITRRLERIEDKLDGKVDKP